MTGSETTPITGHKTDKLTKILESDINNRKVLLCTVQFWTDYTLYLDVFDSSFLPLRK